LQTEAAPQRFLNVSDLSAPPGAGRRAAGQPQAALLGVADLSMDSDIVATTLRAPAIVPQQE
jgi:hypothetical protein